MSDEQVNKPKTDNHYKKLRVKIAKFLSVTLVYSLITAVIVHCVIIYSNRCQMPDVRVAHNGDSAVILFAGYDFESWHDGDCSILPLSDGTYLVGVMSRQDPSDSWLTKQAPVFFLFDNNWDYIKEVPFNYDDFVSGKELSKLLNLDLFEPWQKYIEVSNSFETNCLYRDDDDRNKENNGRLNDWQTDFGVIRQTVSYDIYSTHSKSIFRVYRYDFATQSVKLFQMPEFDEIVAYHGFIDSDSSNGTYLLTGFLVDCLDSEAYENRSFALLFNEQGTIWSYDKTMSDEEFSDNVSKPGVAPKVWLGDESLVVGWPALGEGQDYVFHNLSTSGEVDTFTCTALPEGIGFSILGRCLNDLSQQRLGFNVGDTRYCWLDKAGIWSDFEIIDKDFGNDQVQNYQYFYGRFSLGSNDHPKQEGIEYPYIPAVDIYKWNYTTVFDKGFDIDDYSDFGKVRGAYLEINFNPTSTHYFRSRVNIFFILSHPMYDKW